MARLIERLKHWKRKQRDDSPPANVIMGRGSYGIPTTHAWGEGAHLYIGAFCSIAHGVEVYLGGEHRTDWVTTYPFNVLWPAARHIEGHPRSKGDVVIGNDVWVGAGATIMSGVSIGDGAVIGARAVITRDVAPYAIVAGNPARIVRKRFDETTIQRLRALCWWNWTDAEIETALPLLLSNRTDEFLAHGERIRKCKP